MSTPDHLHHGDPHRQHYPELTDLVNDAISRLAPFSALILTITLVVFFLARYFVFEGFLLRRCYGDVYTRMGEVVRRGFVNHHVAGVAKVVMAVAGAYPFLAVAFGKEGIHSKIGGKDGVVEMGDILVVLDQIFIAMYIFELFYRAKLSPVAIAHHIGAIMIAQSAVAMSLNWEHERDATIEFMLCYVWGFFDIIAEFYPHIAIILYRMYPDRHTFLVKVFRFACISTATGTLVETVTVMWLFGMSWHRWTLPFKVVTPILHVIFSAAQLWGAWNFRSMWLKQRALCKAEANDGV